MKLGQYINTYSIFINVYNQNNETKRSGIQSMQKNSYKYRKVKFISSSCFVNYFKLKNINTFKALGE